METNNEENGEIELLRDAVIAVVAMARKADSDKVKLAMDILLAGTLKRPGFPGGSYL